MSEKTPFYCSFCGKSQHDVLCLIAGPTVFVCDECVALCNVIVLENRIRKIARALASADTQPKAGDVEQAPLVSGAVPEGQTPNSSSDSSLSVEVPE